MPATMKAPLFREGWKLEHPWKWVRNSFAVLGLLFAIITPFMNGLDVGKGAFLVMGLGYSFLLSILSAGIAVLPARLRIWVFVGVGLAVVLCWLGLTAIFATWAWGGWQSIGLALNGMQAACVTALSGMMGAACYGWHHHYRMRHRQP